MPKTWQHWVKIISQTFQHKRHQSQAGSAMASCCCAKKKCRTHALPACAGQHFSNWPFDHLERLQRANPAAEVDAEQAEGPETADSSSQEVPQRLSCSAPSPPHEGSHQGGEGGYWRDSLGLKTSNYLLIIMMFLFVLKMCMLVPDVILTNSPCDSIKTFHCCKGRNVSTDLS